MEALAPTCGGLIIDGCARCNTSSMMLVPCDEGDD